MTKFNNQLLYKEHVRTLQLGGWKRWPRKDRTGLQEKRKLEKPPNHMNRKHLCHPLPFLNNGFI